MLYVMFDKIMMIFNIVFRYCFFIEDLDYSWWYCEEIVDDVGCGFVVRSR